ncbi:MAG: nucleotidyltransferase [Bacteroidales bacterium]|nr:nucleotidyltransferase [Bacteroidales bacterium]
MKPTLLILAAGMGSRYGGLKQMDQVGPSGEAIIDYSIYDAIRAGFEKVTFIIRKNIEKEFREVFESKLKGAIETEFIFQELEMVPEGISFSSERVKPWGTAHAVWVAKDYIREPFVVINADDYYGAGSYQTIADYLMQDNNVNSSNYGMVGYQVQHTLSDFGSVTRGVCEATDEDFMKAVVERTEIVKDGQQIYFKDKKEGKVFLSGDELVSMNFWGFTPTIFDHFEKAFTEFIKENAGKPKKELYIPTVVNDLVARGIATVKILPARDQWFGVTYKEDKPVAVENIRKLVAQGVYTDNLWN